ncbi:hypothetical protein SmJEL517_g00590 [Synchytrium microbalum]|uniref:DnaJ homolog subfamily C member 2 n=1 Tax=Synchytrium microbalum TaxID=1806994 RepID=A0A507CIW7_9FUNG|nr:uncharacterized protein SmJEL517_g00590 [Synchytrium microbalum]TPX37643.1 hypothetical protein SmJEL517_g00590 [Synchytrium microbalum]
MAVPLLLLPPPPSNSSLKDKDVVIHKQLTAPETYNVEAVGFEYLAIGRRRKHKRTLSEDVAIEKALEDAETDGAETVEIDDETDDLLMSDPDNWKDQDHYRILGLSKLRYKATEDDIRRAYRKKVLKHHPDKKNAADRDDSFFKCIQKAWEVLSDPVKRRQWDSVDPEFDDAIPSAKIKGDFFEIYGRAFDANSRYSKKPAPHLGSLDSTRDEVEAFYEFWYNFDSWRGFEALDEDDPDSAESREERRWMERKNKNERQRKKKEENARIIRLVDQATKLDPRIKRFKDEEKAAKEAIKKEKENARRAIEDAKLKVIEDERLAKEKAETEEKAKAAVEKKEREAKKKAAKKEKKIIQGIVKNNGFLLPDHCSAEAVDESLKKVDETLDNLDQDELEAFRAQFEARQYDGREALSLLLEEEYLKVKGKQEDQKAQAAALASERAEASAAAKAPKIVKAPWSPKEVQILIKAVKLFPGGTIGRWEKIAEYVCAHSGADDETPEQIASRQRSPADCVNMSKSVLLSGGMPTAAGARAALQGQAQAKKPVIEIKDAPTTRFDDNTSSTSSPPTPAAPSDTASVDTAASGTASVSGWTPAQQTALEAAIRKYPAAMFVDKPPAERWEKVASLVDGKSVKEVKARIKDLAGKSKTKGKK